MSPLDRVTLYVILGGWLTLLVALLFIAPLWALALLLFEALTVYALVLLALVGRGRSPAGEASGHDAMSEVFISHAGGYLFPSYYINCKLCGKELGPYFTETQARQSKRICWDCVPKQRRHRGPDETD